MTDWTEKYRPSSLSELRGNDSAVDDVREWARDWDDHGEAAVLHGAPGIGKTSAAHALAADRGWETVELNASDQRTADEIERYAGRAASNTTLGGGGRQLVIVDEADNIHGNYDRGGAGAVTRLVKEARQPVVLIANDYYDMSRGLRNATREIEFRDVSARSIRPVLRDLCRKEGIEFETAALERIAEQNDGDLRGAVNDLQAVAEGREELTVDHVVTSDRDRTVDLFPFLDLVMKETDDPREALETSYDVDETPDDLLAWIEENVPKEYSGAALARAYDSLANGDRWLGVVRATQEYSYWRYAGDALAAGVAAARDTTGGGWTRWTRPTFYHSSSNTADEVIREIARHEGTSMATARREILPFLSTITHHCKPREPTVQMAAAYDLEEPHVSFVTGSGETTNKVQSIVADGGERRAELVEEHAGGAFEQAAVSEDSEIADESGLVSEPDDSADGSDEANVDTDDEDADDDQSGLTDFM
ncbi:MAG: replication factor C large subunit [halophilic archaeon J07HB67]|jgi:replication factor C large subunit|nr:MAG: replication factor C large subunit [halophilic archaeon J07HB67]